MQAQKIEEENWHSEPTFAGLQNPQPATWNAREATKEND